MRSAPRLGRQLETTFVEGGRCMRVTMGQQALFRAVVLGGDAAISMSRSEVSQG